VKQLVLCHRHQVVIIIIVMIMALLIRMIIDTVHLLTDLALGIGRELYLQSIVHHLITMVTQTTIHLIIIAINPHLDMDLKLLVLMVIILYEEKAI
jgi:hypothetical protein